MKILKLQLNNSKRLALSSIKDITIDLKNKVQLILGTNGSGKSSLLNELTPLPSDPKDFYPNGFKVIDIAFKGSLYRLTSRLNPSSHSFIKDGEELNQGGTAQVQKTLTQEHFNLRPQVQDLLTGNVRFTRLSPSERKKWFTLLSSTDFDYVLGVYDRLRSKNRDLAGAIKIARESLSTDGDIASNLEVQITSIKNEIEETKVNLKEALTLREHIIANKHFKIDKTKEDYLKALDKKEQQIRQQLNDYGLMDYFKQGNLHVDEVNRRMINCSIKVTQLESELNDINTKLKGLDELNVPVNKPPIIELIEIANTVNLKAYIPLIKEVYSKIIKLNNELNTLVINQDDIKSLQTLEDTLRFSEFSIKEINELIKKEEGFSPHFQALWDYPVKCNHCGEVNHLRLESDNRKVLQLNQSIKVHTETKDNTQRKIDTINKYNQINNELLSLKSEYPDLEWLFVNNNINECIEWLIIESNRKDKLKVIGLDNSTQLELRRIEINRLINQLKLDVHNLDYLMGLHRKGFYSINNINDLKDTYFKLGEDLILNDYDKPNNDYIDVLNVKLEDLNNSLNTLETKQSINNKIKQDIKDMSIKSTHYNQLIKVLSHQNGLIAESIISFLDGFIQDMNELISQIWSYRLELLIDVDNRFDYKFPVNVNDEHTIPDVSKGSSSIQDVIDLSFRLVAMRYLGLQDYPIYLDEFGNTFDERHRLSATDLIANLIVNEQYSQLFVVSHFASQYASIGGSDVVLLDNTNLGEYIPDNANSNTVITRGY